MKIHKIFLPLLFLLAVGIGCDDDGGGQVAPTPTPPPGGGVPPGGGDPSGNLQIAADDAFEKIRDIFEFIPLDGCAEVNSDNFECNYWQLGNAFDTVIDYLIMNPFNAVDFADAVVKKYDETANTPWRCWYDDFGWWAVAAQRALEHPDLWSEEQIGRFRDIAAENWAGMQPGISVWEFLQENFNSLEPLFDGGIWNYFWTTTHIPGVCQTPCDPTNQNLSNSALCGRQNTVTNGLYLVAASMRGADTGDEVYKQAAERELRFLLQWFDPMNFDDISNSLLYPLSAGAIAGPSVVRERVSMYFNGDQDFKYDSDLIWAGDQGLILGGLLRFIDVAPSDLHPQDILDLAKRITDGVLEYLSEADRTLIFPWSNVNKPSVDPIGGPNIGGSPSGDDNDYNTGIGVYMRYLLYAYQTNSEMRQHLQDTGYPPLVLRFAEDFASQDAGLCYAARTNCTDLVFYTNKLAAVVAALGMR
jgi:hypothetical protein